MTKQDEKTKNQKVAEDAAENQDTAVTGVNPVDDVVFGNRPNQEDLTNAIRREVYKEAAAVFQARGIELTEEEKARLLGPSAE